jgi:ABC-type antimicrobial peptide transport system permease subunit
MTLARPKSTASATVHLSLPACLVILLCVLVFVQVLGVPVTMITALMPSTIPEASVSLLGACTISSLLYTSISECFSLLHPLTELRRFAAFHLDVNEHLTTDPQVLALSVFHPPIT